MKKYLSIDIGGTNIKYGVVSEEGSLLENHFVKTPKELPAFKETLVEIVKEFADHVDGVGICAPGQVDNQNGVIYKGGSLGFLHEFAIKAFLEKQFNLNVHVQNDGKAAVLAEFWQGNLQDVSYGAGIILGTGIGGGIITNGSLLEGKHYQAGEFSFMLSQPGKVTDKNMLAMQASAVRFIEKANALLGNTPLDDGITVFEELNKGTNQALLDLFDEFCEYIVFLIINIQVVLDIEKVVIGGGISSQKILIQRIQELYQINKQNQPMFDDTMESIDIEVCKFQGSANLLGAVYPFIVG
ncbi:ROK family protein [Fundicoccus culcitae]|uniref:ROK family protein n=1 Tax=Fundicoccus culcitae TaxID=2969821 RepID=A0ABY5P2T3_9LACT|nr:ROK family protein [Fundicoccus culcitae]UUX33037.1 ROK family protein [Fundicoccus culcitae]